MVRNTGKAEPVRGKIALMATLLVAYGLGSPWAVSRLPVKVGATLGEFHHEVNQLASGNFKAVMPTLPATAVASAPAATGWAEFAADRIARQQPSPLASGPGSPVAGLPSFSLGTMLVGLDDPSRTEAPGAWTHELAESPREAPEPQAASVPDSPATRAAGQDRTEKGAYPVGRMAAALAGSAPRIAFEPINPADDATVAGAPATEKTTENKSAAAKTATEKPVTDKPAPVVARAKITVETAPTREARLALYIPDAPDDAALAAQRAAMTSWARSRGYRVVDFFTTPDPARPEDDILAAAASGAFSAVALWTSTDAKDTSLVDALRARKLDVVEIPASVMPPVLSASVPRDQSQTGSTGMRSRR
jgi:hypothetical protein